MIFSLWTNKWIVRPLFYCNMCHLSNVIRVTDCLLLQSSSSFSCVANKQTKNIIFAQNAIVYMIMNMKMKKYTRYTCHIAYSNMHLKIITKMSHTIKWGSWQEKEEKPVSPFYIEHIFFFLNSKNEFSKIKWNMCRLASNLDLVGNNEKKKLKWE